MANVHIEIFTSSQCKHCRKALSLVNEVVTAMQDKRLVIDERDVLAQIDSAVALGIVATPALVIDGELVFTALPTRKQLHDALLRRLRDNTTHSHDDKTRLQNQ